MKPFYKKASGSTRTVFLIGKYAFKFPKLKSWGTFFKGLAANQNERSISHVCPNYFLPVLWSIPGLLVVMPRCRTTNLPNWMCHCFMADLFHPNNDSNLEALEARNFCEYVTGNYGMYKGKPMCIDYGTYSPGIVQESTMEREHYFMDWNICQKLGIEDEEKYPKPTLVYPKPNSLDLDECDLEKSTLDVEMQNSHASCEVDEI